MKHITLLLISLCLAVLAMAQPYPIINSRYGGDTLQLWNYGDSSKLVSTSPLILEADTVLLRGRSQVSFLVVNRDSFSDPAATIASVGTNGQIVQCFSCDTIQQLLDATTLYRYTYAQASDSAAAGALVPLAWYNITDDSVYIQAITDSTFGLNGYFADSVIWEIDAIEFDFANEHIQQRCDKRGNCVGAAFGLIFNGLISTDPIGVFKWGDDFIVGNTVKDAVFDLTNIVGSGDAFVIDNYIVEQSEVVVGNNGSLQWQKNTVKGTSTWTSLYATNLIFNNQFSNGFEANTDSTNAQIQGNVMDGDDQYLIINRSSGTFLSNTGQGRISCVDCDNANVRSNNLYNGAAIYADSMKTDINANELHRGSELYMVNSDSAFSKNFLDFTARVLASNNNNRSEYNRFIGCGNGLGTDFNVTMNPTGRLQGCNLFSCDTITLDPNTVYNNLAIEMRDVGIGTTLPTAKIQVNGDSYFVTDDTLKQHRFRCLGTNSYGSYDNMISVTDQQVGLGDYDSGNQIVISRNDSTININSLNAISLNNTPGVTGFVGVGTSTPGSMMTITGGDVYVTDIASGIIIPSPNGTCWRLTPDDSGNSVWTSITCPTP